MNGLLFLGGTLVYVMSANDVTGSVTRFGISVMAAAATAAISDAIKKGKVRG